MSYNYSSFSQERFTRTRSHNHGPYTSKPKEYKIYEPKSSDNCFKNSGYTTSQKLSYPSRDNFDDGYSYLKERRYDKHMGYKHEYSSGWQEKNNRSYLKIRENVKIDYIPVRAVPTCKMSATRSPETRRTPETDSNHIFELASNDTNYQASVCGSNGRLSTASSEKLDSPQEHLKVSDFAQDQQYDVPSFWEKIKNSDRKDPILIQEKIVKLETEQTIKDKDEEISSENSPEDSQLKPCLLERVKLEKILFIRDNDKTSETNEKSRGNSSEMSEETEESDEEKYSNIDIMVEKKLMNNGCENNNEDNVFDDYNDGLRKEESEELNNNARPIWENLDSTKVLEQTYKKEYDSIPSYLSKAQEPKNMEPRENPQNEKKKEETWSGNPEDKIFNNPIPFSICDEKFIKSILKIDTETTGLDNCNNYGLFIPWNMKTDQNDKIKTDDNIAFVQKIEAIHSKLSSRMFEKDEYTSQHADKNYKLADVNSVNPRTPSNRKYSTYETNEYFANSAQIIGFLQLDPPKPDWISFMIPFINNACTSINANYKTARKPKNYLALNLFEELTWKALIDEGNYDTGSQIDLECLLLW